MRISDWSSDVCSSDLTAGYIAEGFKAVKIKIGFGLEEDVEVIAAVRAAIGPKARLMIDANHGYDALEAIAHGNRVADLRPDERRVGKEWFCTCRLRRSA